MGIMISSKRHGCDMGYGGFGRFRNDVAAQTCKEFYAHYILIDSASVMFLIGEERKKYFDTYNAKTEDFIANRKVTIEVANFLYQPDCDGGIDRNQAKQIYELIKDCDDNIMYGYVGRPDCAKMIDMKKIFGDKTKVRWY